jgi:NAD-dependent deacetylase
MAGLQAVYLRGGAIAALARVRRPRPPPPAQEHARELCHADRTMQRSGELDATLDAVAEELGRAQRVLFITGAGMSADSGLPTYRGIGGLYEGMGTPEGMPIETVLSGAMFQERPELTWKYLRQVEQACRAATCNAGHLMIARLEQKLDKLVILTQNVDGFHQAAGSKHVIDIHGDLHELSCTACSRTRRVRSYAGLAALPRCACGAVERPQVVLFGESLAEAKLSTLMAELSLGFDMVISVGTSGLFPYIRLPMIRAKVYGWPSVDINPMTNPLTEYARYHLPLGASEACEALWARRGLRRPGPAPERHRRG